MGEAQQLFFCCYMVAKSPVVFKSMHQRVERSSEEGYGRVSSVWLCPVVIVLLQTDQYPCGGTLNQRFCESIHKQCFEDFRGDRPMSGWFSRIIRHSKTTMFQSLYRSMMKFQRGRSLCQSIRNFQQLQSLHESITQNLKFRAR